MIRESNYDPSEKPDSSLPAHHILSENLVYRVYIRVIMIIHLKWTLCLKTQKV
jgi:hypothetical protein